MSELKHYGVIGMKWGIRRYQPYSVKPRLSGKTGRELGKAREYARTLRKNKSGSSTMSNEELRNIYGITEGLENKIQNEILDSYTYEDFIFKLKSKRYELSKIKRMLIHILLDTTKEDFDNLKNCKSNYAHIPAFNHDKKDLLSYISKNSKIPILTSINDNTLAKLTQNQRKLIDYDLNASNIYSILNETKFNQDYTNRL